MKLSRVIVQAQEGVRVILYPQGGLEVEELVPGIGWCLTLDPDCIIPDDTLAEFLQAANELTEKATAGLV